MNNNDKLEKFVNIIFTIITLILIFLAIHFWFPVDPNFNEMIQELSVFLLILLLGWIFVFLMVAIEVASFYGMAQSFSMIFRVAKSYILNENARLAVLDNGEPAYLRFSGYWPFMFKFIINDIWQSVGENKKINTEGSSVTSFPKVRHFVFLVVATIFAVLFSIVTIMIGICSVPFLILYFLAWGVDRIYLIINKIAQPCGNCQKRNLILHYECQNCGSIHKHLVSNSYGLLWHKCKCGYKLPCTFFNGRTSLSAQCPACNAYITGAGTRPFLIQLIGGSNSGKTVYISAFYHEFFKKIDGLKNIDYIIDKNDDGLFADLEDWYEGVPCESTKRMNSQMYPIKISSEQMNVSRKFALYDIAGEMFNSGKADAEINQKQFHYCNGIVFILDPFSNNGYRKEMERCGEELPQYSDIESGDVVNTFLNYMARTGNKSVGSVFQMPFSVVITKADVKAIRQRINMVKIKAEFNKNPQQYSRIDDARDAMCRDFLEEIGLSELTSIIETRFKKVHYFFASPMGHEPNGTTFDSWGVIEPIEWIIRDQDEELAELVI